MSNDAAHNPAEAKDLRGDTVDPVAKHGLSRGYFSISTQFDNVGDALINRDMIRLVSTIAPVVVDISRCPPRFLDTLGIYGWKNTKLVRSRLNLLLLMIWDRIQRRDPYYFLNPGGYFGEIGRLAALASWANSTLLLALVAMGVRLCHVGVSYERIGPRHSDALRRRSALLHRHLARDGLSATYGASIGMNIDGTIPDLAFGAARRETGTLERCWLGISFRLDHDRIETTEHVSRIVRDLDEALPPSIGFKFVSQVSRDQAGLQTLSRLVRRRKSVLYDVSDSIEGCEIAYSDCSHVVGNRLHALLLGALSGATPLAVIDLRASAKIFGLFEELEATEYVFDLREDSGQLIAERIKNGEGPRIDFHREYQRLLLAFSEMFSAETLERKP